MLPHDHKTRRRCLGLVNGVGQHAALGAGHIEMRRGAPHSSDESLNRLSRRNTARGSIAATGAALPLY